MKVKVSDIRAEWEKLTPEQREAVVKWVNETFGQLAEALHAVAVWIGQAFEILAKEVRRA